MNAEDTQVDLDTLVQEKLDADTDFQSELEAVTDDSEKEELLNKKTKEILSAEFGSLSSEAKKNKELADNYKTRAEKAEGKKKEDKGNEVTPDLSKKDDLSTKDIYALMQAKVHEDDVDEVVKAAKLLEKTVPEALKDTTVQAILEKREEHRKTADAQNTRAARPSTKKVSDQDILDKAAKGEIPEPGTPEAEALFWAKRGGKRN